MNIGDFVIFNRLEFGIVKSFDDKKQTACVVYNCDNDWKNFKNYTGASAKYSDLKVADFNEVESLKNSLEDRCCGCHINPPCSFCVDGGQEMIDMIEKLFEAKNVYKG